MEWMILPFKRYADFGGRSRRKEYWMFLLFNVIVCLVLGGASIAMRPLHTAMDVAPVSPFVALRGFWLLGLYGLFSFIPSLAVHVRRFHDQNRSGWFYLLAFIPYVGGLIMIVFMCLPGTPGPNRFGDDPLGGGLSTVFS